MHIEVERCQPNLYAILPFDEVNTQVFELLEPDIIPTDDEESL